MTNANKKLATSELASADEAYRQLRDANTTSFRWLMASYLAINSGGLFVLKDTELHSLNFYIVSGISFYIGILAALASGWIDKSISRKNSFLYARLKRFWEIVCETGDYNEEEHNSIISFMRKLRSPNNSRYAGYLSFIAFSIGIFSIGLDNILNYQYNTANSIACLKTEKPSPKEAK